MIDLEAALVDLGEHLDHPTGEHLATRVTAHIGDPLRAAPRAPRRRLALVAAAVAAALGLAVAAPSVADWLGIGAVDVRQEPPPVSVVGTRLDLGRAVSFDEAVESAGFRPLELGALGLPDEVWVDLFAQAPIITFVYEPTVELPEVHDTGAGAIVSAIPGRLDGRLAVEKFANGAQIEQVRVDGDRGLWIEGAHVVATLGPDGDIVVETARLAANVLVWQHDDITYRLETALDRAAALRIAESLGNR